MSSYIKRPSTPSLIEAVHGALARIEPVSLETMRLVALNFETIDRIGDIDGWKSQTINHLVKPPRPEKCSGGAALPSRRP
jgi:hypothetical protein